MTADIKSSAFKSGVMKSGPLVKSASEALRKDPKKTLALTSLAVVMLVMWGRLFVGGAAPKPAAAAALPGSRAAAPMSDGGATGRPGAGAALGAWLAGPITAPPRNIFAIKLDYFQQDGPRPADATPADRAEKSMALQADQRKERQILVENLRTQAADLRLQSTIMGAEPRAMVNGTLVGEGDTVAGFKVERIEQRKMIVEREGVRLEIAMN
jgi:hypothetical protein